MTKIKKITLHLTEMKLVEPFESSLERVENRESIIVEVEDEHGAAGWGEGVAFSSPWYTEETVKTSLHMLEDFLIPIAFANEYSHPVEVSSSFSVLKRNRMAKAALEMAYWDLYGKQNNRSLSKLLGGTRTNIEAGVVIGLAPIQEMLNSVERALQAGYKRLKVKIKPGKDMDLIREIRRAYPDIPLMADANSAYSLEQAEHLKKLDEFNLLMIEQPLAADDIIDHSILQKMLRTPICLDESIESAEDARKAIQLGSCQIINIKPGRVGGLAEARKIHDLCEEAGIPVWCGGMLETGISRAHNIAAASLKNFTIPGDISASSRYWEEDLILPEVKVKNGTVQVPDGPGLGFEVDRGKLKKYTKKSFVYAK
ncbi:o-succinylbenzoate synthase [Bacillus sp. FJAT-42376]|uniref:o-succinylbenzoate synthase n=1 Tax=Bacillus sp. FJAT-42376 TaxID=2014076 RepID=UPI000F4E667D|nr:o-succinylbenzoate synthase [Bacillus sp. FJAT-42376]AZB44100.1 o-succinylbenzoate synthase [Bacillus sp. FJAT-42376]